MKGDGLGGILSLVIKGGSTHFISICFRCFNISFGSNILIALILSNSHLECSGYSQRLFGCYWLSLGSNDFMIFKKVMTSQRKDSEDRLERKSEKGTYTNMIRHYFFVDKEVNFPLNIKKIKFAYMVINCNLISKVISLFL